MSNTTQLVVFVDRDGVLIDDRVNYARTWADVVIIERSIDALQKLAERRVRVIMVTNQSLVGRGLMDLATVQALNDRIVQYYRDRGAPILQAYFCPHSPEQKCDCRKPKPGMLLQAARDHHIDLSRSFMVGDALRDLEAAESAGVQGFLVRTGQGRDHERELTDDQIAKWPVFDDLSDAVDYLLPRFS